MRPREQKGQIVRKGDSWFLRVYESRVINGEVKRVRAAKLLGPVTTRGKNPPPAIEDRAKELLGNVNGNTVRPEMVLTMGDFWDHVYLPMVEKEKRPSTVSDYKDIWKIHLKPRCAGAWLKDVETYRVQQWLDAVGRTNPQLSRNRLRHIKALASGIFSQAIRLGYRMNPANPVRETRITSGATAGETHAYSLDEIQAMLNALPEPAATIVAVAAFTGLRRGEIAGLQGTDYQDGEIRVSRSIWEGIATDPKTAKSRGAVPVIGQLQRRLDLHRLRRGNPQTGPMFPTESGTPLSLNNVLTRVIQPVLTRCGVLVGGRVCNQAEADHKPDGHEYERDKSLPEWQGWHAFRRGLARPLCFGVPDVVIQRFCVMLI